MFLSDSISFFSGNHNGQLKKAVKLYHGVGFLPRVGECSLEDNEESRALLGHFFHFLSTGKQAVFVNPQRGLLGCCNGEGSIYIMASRGDALEKLEADAAVPVAVDQQTTELYRD